MTIEIFIKWHNAGPHTIWGHLEKKLGREPTSREAADEVRRILREAREEDLDRRGITQERKRAPHSPSLSQTPSRSGEVA